MALDQGFKKRAVLFIQEKIQEKRSAYQHQIDELKKGIAEDTKSSAGDKHNTSRSMAQLELEKLGKAYSEVLKQQELMIRLLNQSLFEGSIRLGDLIDTDKGLIYLGPSLGALEFEGRQIFCLSGKSPLGSSLLSKKKGGNHPL
jgi:hypothetical protein